ncbi:MAG: PVC-type heme-binding CxxCH protein [Planctomycetaceae bacterium]
MWRHPTGALETRSEERAARLITAGIHQSSAVSRRVLPVQPVVSGGLRPPLACWVLPIVSAVLSIATSDDAGASEHPKLEVPPGFVVDRVAGEPQVRYPMFVAFDDRGRLYVAESSGLDLYAELQAQTRRCRISRLEDRDGDGRFDTATVFADQLVFPMGLAWRDGRLYVADPPDLVAYEDRDDDGRAERRAVVITGFGHTDNGSLHGLTFGPDGRLYLTMGNPDGYRLKKSDGSVLAGKNGALLRVRPDGSDPEAVSRGFTNLVEIAFLPEGAIIGTSNIFQHSSGGLRDALVHLVEGGLYPLNYYEDETFHVVTGDLLPPVTRLPTTGVSGIVRYRGRGFPQEMQGSLFSAQHNTRKVQRHVLVAQGATWGAENYDFLTTADPDFHPSDVIEDADGSLLVVDTGAWYVQHCPTGRIQKSEARGGIYRVSNRQISRPADPRGAQIGWPRLEIARLLELLADARPAVAERAERELERRGGDVAAAAEKWIAGQSAAESRQNAAWMLARRGDPASLQVLRKLLDNADPQLASAAAAGLALAGDRDSAEPLARTLSRREPSLRRVAAEALGHCGHRESLPALWRALADSSDPLLTHTLVYAASRLARSSDLEAALADGSPRVQRAALVLLDQPPHCRLQERAVVERLGADDESLRRAAFESLTRHTEWADAARRLMDELLMVQSLSEEQRRCLRSLVLAFQSRADVADEVGRAVAGVRGDVSADRRRLVLDMLAESMAAKVPAGWKGGIFSALDDADGSVQSAAARAAVALDLDECLPRLVALSERESTDRALRIDLLRAVARHRVLPRDASIAWLLDRIADDDHPLDQLSAAEVLARLDLNPWHMSRLLELARERPLVSTAVLLPQIERSAEGPAAPAIVDFLDARISEGWRPTEEDLAKVILRLPPSQQPAGRALAEKLREARERQSRELAGFVERAAKGDPVRGRAVFLSTQAACATCHRIGQEGGQIGPDLTKIGASRSARDLVESIVVPSSTIAQGFESYTVQTTDGLVFNGILARQTPELVVLVDSARKETRLKRDEIEAMVRSSASIMPDGFAGKLTPEHLADLIAWLQSLR